MMTGQVVALNALLSIVFQLPGHPEIAIDFVIDTGFTGYLTLPLRAVEALRLPYIESIPATLATDEEVELPVHAASIVWEGEAMDVRVLATGKRPLLGTALLRACELNVLFIENESVRVQTVLDA